MTPDPMRLNLHKQHYENIKSYMRKHISKFNLKLHSTGRYFCIFPTNITKLKALGPQAHHIGMHYFLIKRA